MASPSCSVWRPPVALNSAVPITKSHEYYFSNNGKHPELYKILKIAICLV
jgi:hypothetical protein